MHHNDEPTLFDTLGRAALVEEVGDAVARCAPPQVFGIHGDWGLGKTSFLYQLQWHLCGSCPQRSDEARHAVPPVVRKDDQDYVVVWFEAWRYQHEKAPILALLHEMRAQLDWWVKSGQKLKEKAAVAWHGALHSMEELTKSIGLQASKLYEAQDRWNRENLAAQLPSNTLQTHLNQAIDLLLKRGVLGTSKKRLLVVLIDDLDRCEPETAFRLLESIKIYLGLRNCVFVLGMNQKVIEDAIAKSLPIGDEAIRQVRAEAYLEKLCQNVWRLPTVADPHARLCDWLIGNPDLQERVRSALASDNTLQCLPPNPRRLKGLANLLLRMAPRLPNDPGDAVARLRDTRLMLVAAYVYQFHHKLFVRWESSPRLYENLLEWSRRAIVDQATPAQPDDPFAGLRRAYIAETDETAATPSHTLTSVHPDPTESNVFWMQPLVVALGDEVTGAAFAPYLSGVPRP